MVTPFNDSISHFSSDHFDTFNPPDMFDNEPPLLWHGEKVTNGDCTGTVYGDPYTIAGCGNTEYVKVVFYSGSVREWPVSECRLA